MNVLAAASFAFFVTLTACARCDESDLSSRPGQSRSSEADPGQTDRHPLLGTWTATITTREYGQVNAQVTLTDDDWLVATAQVSGVIRTENARLVSFASGRLLVIYRGQRHELPAQLSGDSLVVTLPIIGRTSFRRL